MPPAVGAPLKLHPFRGLMLSPNRIGDPSSARAFARPYRGVAKRLDEWETAGHVRRDRTPSLYLHEYTTDGMTVRGLVGCLDLTSRAHGIEDRVVLPHEGIRRRQAQELAERMLEMKMNPAPILLAYHGPEPLRQILTELRETEPWAAFDDKQEQRHRVWALRDPAQIAEVNEHLAGKRALIADGHHRYTSYLNLHDRYPGTGWDTGLTMIVDQDDAPLYLGPIHRELRGPRWQKFLDSATGLGATVQAGERQDCLNQLASDTLVVTDGRRWATMRVPETSTTTSVEWLDDTLVGTLPRAQRTMQYHHTVDAVLDAITEERDSRSPSRLAVLMPSPDFDVVREVARAGRLLPKKATSFQPKPGMGVLMRTLLDD